MTDNAEKTVKESGAICTGNRKPKLSIRTRRALAIAFAALVVLGCVIALDPGNLFPRISDTAYDDQVSSIIELDDQVLVMKRNGTLSQLEKDNSLRKIDQLRAKQILTDGEQLYFSDKNKIFIYNSVDQSKSVFWQDPDQDDIELDFINHDVFIYHRGNHEDYTLIDRLSGQSRPIFNRNDADFFTFEDANDNFAVFSYDYFNYQEKPYIDIEGLFVLDLQTFELRQIYDGGLSDAHLSIGDKVYAMPLDIDRGNGERWSSKIISIDLTTQSQQEINLPEVSLTRLQAFTCSGNSLFFATFEDDWPDEDNHGNIYRYNLDTGQISHLGKIGTVWEIIASSNHVYYLNRHDLKDSQIIIQPLN